ncbi:MAG: glycosyltransferase [Acholeplasmataceae bacterium]|nr:glycosyltransferase [Acholeplasmataceae bacterium]
MNTKDDKLNIGLFVDAFFPMIDGVIVVVDNYAKKMSEFANVTVFAPKSRIKGYKDSLPYRIVRSKCIKVPLTDYDLSLPFFDRKFRKELRRSRLDIVHIHSPFTIGKIGISYAKKNKIPLLATLHSQYRKDFEERTKSKTIADLMIKEIMHTFNKCDELFAVNHRVVEIFNAYGAKKTIKVFYNGTDLKPLENLSLLDILRDRHQIRPDEKVFLFVGRIDVVKNIFFVLDSLLGLKKMDFKFKMLFIGSGPQEKEMKAKIEKFNMSQQVIMVGKVVDRIELSAYYKLADLFLFPSLYDASSLVQIEAASQMTPALFIEGAATADTITKDVNGYVSENDVSRYKDKIIEIFGNPEKHEAICKKAFEDLYWTWDRAVDVAYQNYLRMIKEKGTTK